VRRLDLGLLEKPQGSVVGGWGRRRMAHAPPWGAPPVGCFGAGRLSARPQGGDFLYVIR
jgi:hypothetical protein